MKVSAIYIYPVKSLGGISLLSANLVRSGFQFDRQWMVVEPDGTFMTQRKYPQMALIGTSIENNQLVLSTFGMEPLVVAQPNNHGDRINTAVWGDPVNAARHDPISAEWLSQALDSPCELVSFPTDEIRQCDTEFAKSGEHTKFADGFPLLLLSQESLDDLNQRLDVPVGMDRFRPNIVVKGCTPFAEDRWNSICVNEINLRFAKRCPRCSVPTVNQQTGMLSGPDPIHTLSTYRRTAGEIFFGVNLIPGGEGVIRVGDPVFL